MRYLGNNIFFNITEYAKQNFYPLLVSTKQRLKAWDNLPLSLIGRMNLVKIKATFTNIDP